MDMTISRIRHSPAIRSEMVALGLHRPVFPIVSSGLFVIGFLDVGAVALSLFWL